MDKETILEEAKKDMNYLLKSLDLENIDTTKKSIMDYFSFLEKMIDLEDLVIDKHETTTTEEPPAAAETDIAKEEKQHNDESNKDLINKESDMYLVERKIRGAYVPEIEGFIPEGIVRRLDIEHHDYVYAEKIDEHKYIYTLAAKGEGKDPENRRQINYCIVENEAGMLVTKRTVGSDECPNTIILNPKDIREMEIDKGDIIDIAFFSDTPERNKILWKHNTSSNPKNNERNTNLSKENRKTLRPIENDIDDSSLEGISVLVIGNEPKKALYKFSIEQRGGTFLWADAQDDLTFLEAQVKKSDKVIFLLKVSGHTGMKQIKALCKKYNKPFLTTFSTGKSTVLKMAEEKEMSNA